MKYIYIICLALSSVFTYKHLSANSHTFTSAFFIPGGAFQQNTQTYNIEQMKPRYTQPTSQNKSNSYIEEDDDDEFEEDEFSTPKENTINNSIVQVKAPKPTPVAESVIPNKATSPSPVKNQATTPKKAETIANAIPNKQAQKKKKVATKYSLDDKVSTNKTQNQENKEPETKELSYLEKINKKSAKDLLNAIPSPDFKLPKYQQIYPIYGLELRSALRRGYLPDNYEQEETLAKANSMRRFKVK